MRPVLQRDDRRHAEHQDHHIVPARVVRRIEQEERAVQQRHDRAEHQEHGKIGQPRPLARRDVGEHAAHPEQRQPDGVRGPALVMPVGEVDARGDVRREEIALDDVDIALGVQRLLAVHAVHIEQHPPALVAAAETGVVEDRKACRQEQHRADEHAEHGFHGKAEEILQIDAERPLGAAEHKVHNAERDLTGEHKVVHHTVDRDGERKLPAAVVLHQFLHADEQQREEGDDLVELIEENVVNLEAGEGVQQCADDGVVLVFNKALEVRVGDDGGRGELEHIDRRHQVGRPGRREQAHQPEKRAAEQVVGIAADEVGAEVGQPVPAEIPLVHHAHAVLVKRDLLHVVIAVIEKDRRAGFDPFHDHKGG